MAKNGTRIEIPIILLGVYMLLMGVVGYVHTGSPMPILISGSLGVLTALCGYLIGRGYHVFARIGVIWLVLLTGMMAYMTFGRVDAHPNPTPFSEFVFGSMGLFSLYALISLVRWRIRE